MSALCGDGGCRENWDLHPSYFELRAPVVIRSLLLRRLRLVGRRGVVAVAVTIASVRRDFRRRRRDRHVGRDALVLRGFEDGGIAVHTLEKQSKLLALQPLAA